METNMTMLKLIRAILALVVVLAAPALAGTTTLKGTVTYRERIALPPEAWLRVTLVELDGQVPVLGASAHIPARGQVPMAFVLDIHSDIDVFGGAYGLMAEISSHGRVQFLNPVPVPVSAGAPASGIILNYAPAPPELALPPPASPALLDVVWTVTSIGGRPVQGEAPLTLSIAADHRVGGSGGCNNYFTEAMIEDDRLAFGPAAATRMACALAIMDQETAYFAALAAVASYELDDAGLRLLDAANVPLVGLIRAAE
jgi:putative lipoprotein